MDHFSKGDLGVRHYQIFLMFVACLIQMILVSSLSVGIIGMTDSTVNPEFPTLNYSSVQKGNLHSMIFYGNFISAIPAGAFANKYGPKLTLTVLSLVTGICSLFIAPAAIYGDYFLVCLLRVIHGLAQGFLFPSINMHLAKWVVPEERGKLLTFAMCGFQAGVLMSMVLGGILAKSPGGWPSIFIVSGGLSVLYSIINHFLVRDSPADHTSISSGENNYIQSQLEGSCTGNKNLKVPWSKIAKSRPLLVILWAHTTSSWGYWTLLSLIPTYIQKIHKLDLNENGLVSSLPYLASLISAVLYGYITDIILVNKIMSTLGLRKFWSSVALYGGALVCLTLSLCDVSMTIAVMLFTIGIATDSAANNGWISNLLDIAPNFAGVSMGITVGPSSIAAFVAPTFAGIVLKDEENVGEWKIVFGISAALYFLGGTFYNILASSEIQPWNDPSNNKEITSETPSNGELETFFMKPKNNSS